MENPAANPADTCTFCKIVRGELPSTIVYEDDTVLAFEDINPVVPVHTLVIPKTHYQSAAADVPEDLLGHVFSAATKVAAIKGVDKTGYRLLTNIGEDGRQTVLHLHVHVLGGTQLSIGMSPAD
ncbi:MAG: histidine triad nucleotide-binding protein [Coriobacteriia bacterium]|nr:histidine triad nucleotide-binding protein [Coriobacteriia bacterium]